jgi:hypothetical protein
MTENTHQRPSLIYGGVGWVFLPKRMLSEHSANPLRIGIPRANNVSRRIFPVASRADWSRFRWKRTACPRVLLTFAFDSPTFWDAGPDEIGADARKPEKDCKVNFATGE